MLWRQQRQRLQQELQRSSTRQPQPVAGTSQLEQAGVRELPRYFAWRTRRRCVQREEHVGGGPECSHVRGSSKFFYAKADARRTRAGRSSATRCAVLNPLETRQKKLKVETGLRTVWLRAFWDEGLRSGLAGASRFALKARPDLKLTEQSRYKQMSNSTATNH